MTFESHCHFFTAGYRVGYVIKTPSIIEVEEGEAGGGGGGRQVETSIDFVVWWALFEYISFEYLP